MVGEGKPGENWLPFDQVKWFTSISKWSASLAPQRCSKLLKRFWGPHLSFINLSMYADFFSFQAEGMLFTIDTQNQQSLRLSHSHVTWKKSAYIEGFLELKWGLQFFFSILECLWGASDADHFEIDVNHFTWLKGSQFSPGFPSPTIMKFGTHILQVYSNIFCKTPEWKAKRGSEASGFLNNSMSADSTSCHMNPGIKLFV
jgi:hypothetical protein